eukprot:gene26949-33137_t
MAVAPVRRFILRTPFTIECNRKKGLGVTKNENGSMTTRARTSGFRARKACKTGRNVLKARRKKGRANLVPASIKPHK